MLLKNKDGLYECAICHNAAFDSVRGISNHVRIAHGKDARAYYDEYVKLSDEGVCKVCGNPTKFRSITEGYRDTCSHKCFGILFKNDPEKAAAKHAKTVATCMERYGTTNGGGTAAAQEKAQQTHLAKRGVRFAMQSKEVQDAATATFKEKYGATTYLHSDVGKAAVEATNMEKFNRPNFFSGKEGNDAARAGYMAKHGVDHNMHDPEFLSRWKERQFTENGGKYYVQTDEFKQKSYDSQVAEYGTWYSASEEGKSTLRKLMLAEHGVEHFFQSNKFKESSKSTLNEKYGVDNYSQTKEWNDKVHETSMRVYNVPHFTQSDAVKEKSKETCMKNYNVPNFAMSTKFHMDVINRYIIRLAQFNCDLVCRHSFSSVKFKCNVCGHVCTEQAQFIKFRTEAGLTPCTHCMPKNPPVSVEEREVAAFIESFGHKVDHYDRDFLGTYGADIVVEDCKIIVEYDGVYWHSELFHDNGYHLRKKILAEEKGYRLIHIFSDEWMYKNDIVKSRLRYLFGMASVNKVYARDCEVRLVDPETARTFLDRNHIQGLVNSPDRYGLYDGSRLVALMTFGKSRFESNVVELLRFCPDRDVNVVGGAGKLFSAFRKDHPDVDHIVSYADARWSTSHAFYEKLGFEFTAMSAPGYFIVDGDIRKNRMQFQRHKIAGPDDEGKTEHEITLDRGLFRIYDCGQYRYDWTRSES